MQNETDIISRMLKQAREHSGRKSTFTSEFFDIKRELRLRRKLFLGSDLSLRELVAQNDVVDDKSALELSRYLTEKSMLFWRQKDEYVETFFLRFYQLTIASLCGKKGGSCCVDDILLTAESLALSKAVFVDYMKDVLPDDLIGELFDFMDTYDESMFSARFVDTVLGAISVFLGVMGDPKFIVPQTVKIPKEVVERVRNKKARPNHTKV